MSWFFSKNSREENSDSEEYTDEEYTSEEEEEDDGSEEECDDGDGEDDDDEEEGEEEDKEGDDDDEATEEKEDEEDDDLELDDKGAIEDLNKPASDATNVNKDLEQEVVQGNTGGVVEKEEAVIEAPAEDTAQNAESKSKESESQQVVNTDMVIENEIVIDDSLQPTLSKDENHDERVDSASAVDGQATDLEQLTSTAPESKMDKEPEIPEQSSEPSVVALDQSHDPVPTVVVETVHRMEDEQDGEEEVTSTADRMKFLKLAAEHDRVDILKEILEDSAEEKETLLTSGIPPLHLAVAYGSVNATQCLLRMGADPSLRPDVAAIKEEMQQVAEEIPNINRFDGLSVWELAFGLPQEQTDLDGSSSSLNWFSGGDSTRKRSGLEISASKREAIRYAFTAEALRCIASDEVKRLKQLIGSGMPETIDIGGKTLYDWSVEMGALGCEELLRPFEAARHNTESNQRTTETGSMNETDKPTAVENSSSADKSPVLRRVEPGVESVAHLINRLDELESLAQALSTCLDNLAEEVSVCHGLLLMGGGASALASHVRSLKLLKQQKLEELELIQEKWESSEDELLHCVKEGGKEAAEIFAMSRLPEQSKEIESTVDEETQKQQVKAQIAATENKVRKLRASIADLSEENTKDLEEVGRRGLTGGINLVRGLRDEIREIDFNLSEVKSAEAACRAKITLIQSTSTASINTKGSDVHVSTSQEHVSDLDTTATQEVSDHAHLLVSESISSHQDNQQEANSASTDLETSKIIASGASRAIALRHGGTRAYFPVDLWRIILRIIGFERATVYNNGANIMIV